MKYLRSQIDHIKKYIEIMLMLTKKKKKTFIAILFYPWQKSHCFLGNREQGIENR